MKKVFAQGIVAGILASTAGVIYFEIYQSTLLTGFDKVVNAGSIIGASVISCMLIALCHVALYKLNKLKLRGWLNMVVLLLSFMSIIGPIGMSLPLDIQNPELFPGLVIPMHFFPALAYFGIAPFFDSALSRGRPKS